MIVLDKHFCYECGHVSDWVKIEFDITEEEIKTAKKQHPDWVGVIGRFRCPCCGTVNFVSKTS